MYKMCKICRINKIRTCYVIQKKQKQQCEIVSVEKNELFLLDNLARDFKSLKI